MAHNCVHPDYIPPGGLERNLYSAITFVGDSEEFRPTTTIGSADLGLIETALCAAEPLLAGDLVSYSDDGRAIKGYSNLIGIAMEPAEAGMPVRIAMSDVQQCTGTSVSRNTPSPFYSNEEDQRRARAAYDRTRAAVQIPAPPPTPAPTPPALPLFTPKLRRISA